MTYLQANQIENEVQRIAAAYPNICETVNLRRSFEHQPVTGLVIKNKAVTDIVRPRVLITAGTHAREWAPPDALLTFTDDLLRAYAFRTSFTDPAFVYDRVMTAGALPTQVPYDKYVVTYDNVKKIVEKLETYIVPMTNPDGRNFSLNYQAFWRKNRNSKEQLQQVITMIGAPIGGSYTLTVKANGATATTGPIAYDASPADIETELTALPNLAGAKVQAREVSPKGPDRGIVVQFNVAADLMTVVSSVTGATVFVAWYDGVDINRNFDIAFEREVYYAPVGEQYTTPAGDVRMVSGDPDYRRSDYRGLHAFSEIETVNVRQVIQEKAIDYYLDLHLFASKILIPWGMETDQSSDNTQWFGNSQWDRGGANGGRDGLTGTAYEEWIPAALLTGHKQLGTAMKDEINRAAGANADAQLASTYDVEQPLDKLYPLTGSAQDYMFSLQFGLVFHNPDGNNKYAITFEAGSEFDGGFFPDQTTQQYSKVRRDIYGGLFGFLLHAAK